jgi:hypothetical protein
VLLKGVSRSTILAAVENLDVGAIIIGLLRSKREQTHIEALHFIFDRVMGKPKQDLSVTGGVVQAHVRDPLLAALPKEALEVLARSYGMRFWRSMPSQFPASWTVTLSNCDTNGHLIF